MTRSPACRTGASVGARYGLGQRAAIFDSGRFLTTKLGGDDEDDAVRMSMAPITIGFTYMLGGAPAAARR